MKLAPLICAFLLSASLSVAAQGNIEINSPAIGALKQSMQQRHSQLAPLYQAGAVGLAGDGTVALRSASSVPLAVLMMTESSAPKKMICAGSGR